MQSDMKLTRNEIVRQGLEKAKNLFASGRIYQIEVGTTRGLINRNKCR